MAEGFDFFGNEGGCQIVIGPVAGRIDRGAARQIVIVLLTRRIDRLNFFGNDGMVDKFL